MKRIIDIIESDPIVQDYERKKNCSEKIAIAAKKAELKIALIEQLLCNFKPTTPNEKYLANIVSWKILAILNGKPKQVDICKTQGITRQGLRNAEVKNPASVEMRTNQHKLAKIKELLTIDKL